MLVFIDDSGDPGFQLDKGSSTHFVIGLVIFDDELEAQKVNVKIRELGREVFMRDDVEFKFNHSTRKIRERFLEAVAPFAFRVRCIVVTKALIRSPQLREDTASFYSYNIKLALENNQGSINNAKIRIDRSGDREFRKRLVAYLRRELNTDKQKVIADCKLVDSKDSTLIQMADMIVGAIRRSHDATKIDRQVYRDIVESRIEDEWMFQ